MKFKVEVEFHEDDVVNVDSIAQDYEQEEITDLLHDTVKEAVNEHTGIPIGFITAGAVRVG